MIAVYDIRYGKSLGGVIAVAAWHERLSTRLSPVSDYLGEIYSGSTARIVHRTSLTVLMGSVIYERNR